VLTMTVPDNDL